MDDKIFPDIYVMSKFPNLLCELKKVLPTKAKIINVEMSDTSIKWNKNIIIKSEEIKALEDAQVIVIDCMTLAKMMYDLPKAQWVQITWAGAEFLFEELDKTKPLPHYRITRFVDEYYEQLMSNYVIGQIISNERCLCDYQEAQKLKKWARPLFPNSRVISDLVIGVLGAGKLGNSVANLLLTAGATVISFVKTNCHQTKHNRHKFTQDLAVIFESCDYICNVLPSTCETRGLLDNDVLQQCKKKPVFINIGRGDIINENSIIKALSNDWISKAILDVFETEPLPSHSLLWTTPNVIITPHIGAIPQVSGCAKLIAENYRRYICGENLLNEVKWDRGY